MIKPKIDPEDIILYSVITSVSCGLYAFAADNYVIGIMSFAVGFLAMLLVLSECERNKRK